MDIGAALLASKIDKLERRLRHQRAVGAPLGPYSALRELNDRVAFEMEVKLFKLKAKAVRGSGLRII